MESIEYLEHSKGKLKDLSGRYKFMLATMLAVLAGALYNYFTLHQTWDVIQSASEGDENAWARYEALTKRNPITIVIGIIGIINVVAVSMFIYHAALNVYDYYERGMKHTPGWMVGWFFIPVAHIFMAFIAIKELSKGSRAMVQQKSAEEIDAEKPHASMLVWGVLWSLQLLAGYILTMYMFMQMQTMAQMDPDEIELYTFGKTFYFTIIINAVNIINGIALLIFASKMTKEHSEFRIS